MVDDKISINFACQRCLQPIVLDDSFENISIHDHAELALPIFSNTAPEIDTQDENSYDHFIPPYMTDSINGNNGFMVVSDGRENQTLSSALKVKADLFDFLSSNSEIDHPLCDECADSLLELMDRQLKIAESELEDYKIYLKKLESSEENLDLDELQKELTDLDEEEKRLLDELSKLRTNEESIKASIKFREEEKSQLDEQEATYWREYTKHRRDLMCTEDDKRSLECQIVHGQNQLDKLKKTNVFNVTFHIWHHGHFGTINNFRLGRLSSAPVDWSEINAAWGQTALLLCALARKVNLTFKRYKIVPYGNHSYVEVLGEGKELPLYGTGGFKFFWDTKFDAAMVAFLDCLSQFKEEVEKGDTGFCLPYKMDKGKIEDSSTGNSYSIKIQFNSEEQWTKALKFMLTNLKWGVAWVSSQFTEEKLETPKV
ncbi:beclin-1-like protein [Condylostylus longicornis]|uniref:beclin-1-like protein n=1 Tax=Condylostylus longicornis TaxID=2530218 RepID=UPI00244DDCA8|nr:beclin-1-like protein [Condylostylus longicornis]